jgi:hypothetical protein
MQTHPEVQTEINTLLTTTLLNALAFLVALEARDFLDAFVAFIVPIKDQPKQKLTFFMIKFVFVLALLIIMALILT